MRSFSSISRYSFMEDWSKGYKPRAPSIMSFSLQRRAKRKNQSASRQSGRNFTEKGELGLSMPLSVAHTAPGSVSGRTWLGQTYPQL